MTWPLTPSAPGRHKQADDGKCANPHDPVPGGTTVNSDAPPHGAIVREATTPRQCHWSLLPRSGATLAGRGLDMSTKDVDAAVAAAAGEVS